MRQLNFIVPNTTHQRELSWRQSYHSYSIFWRIQW